MPLLSSNERSLIRCVVEAFRAPDLLLSAETIAARGVKFVDDLADSGSERIEQIRQILTGLDVALAFVDRGNRESVRRRLTEMDRGQGLFGLAPREARDLARFCQRLAYILIYGTLDANGRSPAGERLGYDLFADRARGPATAVAAEPLLPRDIFVLPDEPLPDRRFDVVIVGSGSGGAVMARRLVEKHGLHVALLESGHYVPEAVASEGPHLRRRPAPHDELETLVRYYKHGGLQIARGQSMFVFQAECLGGTSVVNNAVCFRMPEHAGGAVAGLRKQWKEDFGIPWTGAELDAAYDRIAAEVGIGPADQAVLDGFLNPSVAFLRQGAAATAGTLRPCDVNIKHDPKCAGCGYCNLVCALLRKSSVLQTMLPAAARASSGSLTIFTGRKAVKIVGERQGGLYAAQAVLTRTKKSPHVYGAIRGGKIVIAAGAVGSSALLERTEPINALGLPIGERFSFNFGSPVHADFDAEVRAFDGLQIGHYYKAPGGGGFVVETWYNPPATQTLALPGWMDELAANVARYNHYACAAPLVGSTAGSWIDAHWVDEGEDIHIELQPVDLQRLKEGLTATCELFFAADPAPRRLLISAPVGWELTRNTFRDRIAGIESFEQIQIGTGHPQGGNCMAARGGHEGGPGVVTPEFRVHGCKGLYLADASVFPTSLGVNPHWTVMAIADLASEVVARD